MGNRRDAEEAQRKNTKMVLCVRLCVSASLRLHSAYGRTQAEQVSISPRVVDSSNGWPELVIAQPACGEGGLLARVLVAPRVARHGGDRVRGVLQRVVGAVGS